AVKHSKRLDMERAYEAGLSEVIDVRVQRLMPGMYPSIPGWHCDAVPRPNYFAQPDFSLINPHTFHVTCLVDTSTERQLPVASTEFLAENLKFKYNEKAPVWQQLHRQIEKQKWYESHAASPGVLYTFNS